MRREIRNQSHRSKVLACFLMAVLILTGVVGLAGTKQVKADVVVSADGFEYEYNTARTGITINACNLPEGAKEIRYPAKINGVSVVGIKGNIKNGNWGENEVERVIIPNGVEIFDTTGYYYFQNVTCIELPDTLKKLTLNSFNKLNKISLPNSLENIDIQWCPGIESLKLPDKVTDFTCYNCTGLKEVVINEDLTHLGWD